MSIPSAYFGENVKWSLLGYLKYREKAEDFSMDKAVEHRNYLKDLEYVISTTESGRCREQAAVCISNFQDERQSLGVKIFWQRVQYTAGVLEMAIVDRVQQQHILTEKITMTMEQRFTGGENTCNKRQKLSKTRYKDVVTTNSHESLDADNFHKIDPDNIVDLTEILESHDDFEFDLKEFNSIFNASDVQCARKEWYRLVGKLAVMPPDDVNHPRWKYAVDVINAYLTEFELGCRLLQNRNLSEHMYSCNFIEPVIGGAIRSINLLDCTWGEVDVQSTAERKNEGKDLLIEVNEIGHNADGVIRINNNNAYEIGILEVSYSPLKKDLTKDANDLFKLRRELKDCLNYIIKKETRAGRGDIRPNELKIVGMHSSGFTVKVFVMELCNRKYVIKPYGQFDIPANFHDIHCLQHAMAVCWQTRNLLIGTAQSLKRNKYQKKKGDRPNETKIE